MTSQSTTDSEFLQRALTLAEGGRGRVSPNPLVGAVIVRDGQIIGEGFHAELQTRPYKNYRPGLQDQEWGSREMTVQDGAGNKIIFFRDLPK